VKKNVKDYYDPELIERKSNQSRKSSVSKMSRDSTAKDCSTIGKARRTRQARNKSTGSNFQYAQPHNTSQEQIDTSSAPLSETRKHNFKASSNIKLVLKDPIVMSDSEMPKFNEYTDYPTPKENSPPKPLSYAI